MDDTGDGAQHYTVFEPATDVENERGYALALAVRTLRELGDALIEGRERYATTLTHLDPAFAAVAGRSLQLKADELETTAPPRHDGNEKAPAFAAPGPLKEGTEQ